MKSNDVLYRLINSRNNHLMMISKMKILDGVGSLYNLTGNYYPITPINKNILRAAERVSTLTKVWDNVYNDLGKSVNMFAKFNNLPQSISIVTNISSQININGNERTKK
jgi:hypothetical protein